MGNLQPKHDVDQRGARHRLLLIAGSGRSGTTWIGNTVASCTECIGVHEPMHPKHLGRSPTWGDRSALPGPYLRTVDSHPAWNTFFHDVLARRISTHWTRADWVRVPKIFGRWPLLERVGYRVAWYRYRHRAARANVTVVKEIHANLMLGWLERNFHCTVIFIVRHPCAVISSRMRLGAEWEPFLSEALGQPALMEDFLEPYRAILNTARTPLQRQAALWCIENVVPLMQAAERGWQVYCYEDFFADREKTFGKLFDRLDLEPTRTTERFKNTVVSAPRPDFGDARPWHGSLTEADGEEVLEICRAFGLALYGRQRMPLSPITDVADSLCRLRAEARSSRACSQAAGSTSG